MPGADAASFLPLIPFAIGAGWTFWLYRVDRLAPFDTLINAAIKHILVHNPSTHQSRLHAELKVLQGILDLAKAGKMKISGSLDEGVPPSRIPRRKLRQLRPIEMVIPRSEEAPEGHVYALVPVTPPKEFREYRRDEQETYTNLLVKSREFYRH